MQLNSLLNRMGWMLSACILFITASCSDATGSKADEYRIEGTINGAPNMPVYLQQLVFADINRPRPATVDTAFTDEAGKFVFTGNNEQPIIVQLQLANERFFIPIGLQNQSYHVTAQRGDMQSVRFEEPLSQQMHDLTLRFRSYGVARQELLEVSMQARRQQNPSVMDSLEQAYMSLLDVQISEMKAFIDSVDDPLLEVFALENLPFRQEFEYINAFLQQLQTDNPEWSYTKELAFKVSRHQRELDEISLKSMLGKQAPEIAQPGVDGTVHKLSDLKGKVVLVDFWASWCQPCRRENPNVVKVWNEYKDKGFEVYSVSLDDNPASWRKAISDDGLAWNNHVSEVNRFSNSAVPQYKVKGIPSAFLLDRNGVIVAENLRGSALEEKVAELTN